MTNLILTAFADMNRVLDVSDAMCNRANPLVGINDAVLLAPGVFVGCYSKRDFVLRARAALIRSRVHPLRPAFCDGMIRRCDAVLDRLLMLGTEDEAYVRSTIRRAF